MTGLDNNYTRAEGAGTGLSELSRIYAISEYERDGKSNRQKTDQTILRAEASKQGGFVQHMFVWSNYEKLVIEKSQTIHKLCTLIFRES
jgi:hypothetical protein